MINNKKAGFYSKIMVLIMVLLINIPFISAADFFTDYNVHYYSFDNTTCVGFNVTDLAGNVNATLNNTMVNGSSGIILDAVNTTALNDFISVNHPKKFSTVSLWVRINEDVTHLVGGGHLWRGYAQAPNVYIGSYTGTLNLEIITIDRGGGKFIYWIANTNITHFNKNQYYHLLFVNNPPNDVRLYINGVDKGNGLRHNNPTTSAYNYNKIIFNSYELNGLNASYDEIGLFDHNYSASTSQNLAYVLYNNGEGFNYYSPIYVNALMNYSFNNLYGYCSAPVASNNNVSFKYKWYNGEGLVLQEGEYNISNITSNYYYNINNLSIIDFGVFNSTDTTLLTFSCQAEYEFFNTTWDNSSYTNISKQVNIEVYNITNMSLNQKRSDIYFIGEYNSSTETTYNGTIRLYIPLYEDYNNYEVRIKSNDFNDGSLFLVITNISADTIKIYLEPNSSLETQVVSVVDTSNSPVTDGVLRVQKEVLNETDLYYTVGEVSLNGAGKANLYLTKDSYTYYRFAVIINGDFTPIMPDLNYYTQKTNFISGVSETVQIIVNLESSSFTDIDEFLSLDTSLYWSDDNLTINYYWSDSENIIQGARLLIEGRYVNQTYDYVTISNTTSNSMTGILNYTFVPINNTLYKISGFVIYGDREDLTDQALKYFEGNVLINRNSGMLFAVIIIVVVLLITIQFGLMVSLILGVLTIAVANLTGLVDVPVTIITSLICFIIILFVRVRKNEE